MEDSKGAERHPSFPSALAHSSVKPPPRMGSGGVTENPAPDRQGRSQGLLEGSGDAERASKKSAWGMGSQRCPRRSRAPPPRCAAVHGEDPEHETGGAVLRPTPHSPLRAAMGPSESNPGKAGALTPPAPARIRQRDRRGTQPP
uniref:Uncharacterized protein n=1 Tax=Rousettus aegyptiacus TaxID=9407 RepID=A0A7J8BSI1_ROUAE|nr:hypothetical protein HJG63_009570 [Rousettus aegyptiacus]